MPDIVAVYETKVYKLLVIIVLTRKVEVAVYVRVSFAVVAEVVALQGCEAI